MSKRALYTIGHSTRSIDEFVDLLRSFRVTAVADVRSHPFSRHNQHFNREDLSNSLRQHDIAYVFLGKELGARREEDCCYVDGQAKYRLIKQTPAFQAGLERVRKGASSHRLTLMCAERDPITCHRTILVAKALRSEFDIRHIISVDEIESHEEAEQRLLRNWRLDEPDLFSDASELLEEAYCRQAQEIEYVERDSAAFTRIESEP